MKKILVATHGNYAQGVISSLSIIAGQVNNITYINAYTESKNINEAIETYFEKVNEDDQVIILTDIFGGSVNQAAMNYLKKENVFLITGFNLALLLELSMLDSEEIISENKLREIVENSKAQIIYVNDVLKETNNDDFD